MTYFSLFFKVALKSIKNRLFTSLLTIFSITLSVTLFLSVERTQRAAQDGFTQSISQTDLLVGARTGPINLILYTVFNMGSATNNISWQSYQDIKSLPEVAWTIPYSLGDGHKGYRVIATDENFYKHYRYRGDQSIELSEGSPALDIWQAVIGSEVAQKLKYKIGDKIVLAHGVTRSEGVVLHDDKPFVVSGLIKPTGTAIDQSIYISLYGIEAIHVDWKDGYQKSTHKISPETIKKDDLKTEQITAFFLRTQSRLQILNLQRTINTYESEPLLAIIPGSTLNDIWRGLSQLDKVLKVISFMVLCVGLAAMLSTLLSSLNERRREMAILRSIGATPRHIFFLLVLESASLTFAALVLGLTIEISFFALLKNWLQSEFGLFITGQAITNSELVYLSMIFVCGVAVGLIPAYRALKNSLKDGLSVKV